MEVCERCGKSEEEVRLYGGIYLNEAIKVCERCSLIDSIILLKTPNTAQLRESEKSYSVNQRLKILSGLAEKKSRDDSIYEELKRLNRKPELEKPEPKIAKLVDNFHWRVQSARRMKKISIRQLAEFIGESESAIKLLEAGRVPENSDKLIRKLEQFFQIVLFKKPLPVKEKRFPIFQPLSEEVGRESESEDEKENNFKKSEEGIIEIPEEVFENRKEEKQEEEEGEMKNAPTRILTFRPEAVKSLTISDLNKIKKQKEEHGIVEKSVAELRKERQEEIRKKIQSLDAGRRKIKPMQAKDYSKETPTIAELLEKKNKEKKDKLIGGEIEIGE